eukprot:SAG25_NODE_11_length_28117_cov_24.264901_10_plen_96_part_00
MPFLLLAGPSGTISGLILAVMQQLCSQKEQEFSQQYNESVDAFMKEVDLDLMSDQTPPRYLYIDVLAKVEVGTIVTGSGMTLNLKKVRCSVAYAL